MGMVISRWENKILDSNEHVPTTTTPNEEEFSDQFVVNINSNSGTVVLGPNMVVNVYPSERLAEGDLTIADFGFSEHQSATTSQSTHLASHFGGKRLAKVRGLAPISNFFPVVKNERSYQKRKQEKRKCCAGATSENPRKQRSDRKRVKRQRCDSRCSAPSSDDDVTDPTLNELAVDSDSANFHQALQTYHCIITRLHPLRDSGLWDEFDRVAQDLLDKAVGDLAREIIIFVEKSVALSLRKELELSEEMLNNAVKKIAQTSGSIRLLLEVLSNSYLALLYRRRKLLGKTQEYLQIAGKIASGFPPCLAIAILLYEMGSYERDLASTLSGSRKESAIAEAKNLMKQCTDLCFRLDREKVYVRKQHLCVSKMALMSLQCETSRSRSQSISGRNIVEAKRCLETLESECYTNKEVQGTKIQRLMAKADLLFREEQFFEAERVADEALKIAQRLGYKLDIKPLEERLTDILRKITESASSSEAYRLISGVIDSCSGSSKNNTPYSSDYEDKL